MKNIVVRAAIPAAKVLAVTAAVLLLVFLIFFALVHKASTGVGVVALLALVIMMAWMWLPAAVREAVDEIHKKSAKIVE